jgi:hypothetical protein
MRQLIIFFYIIFLAPLFVLATTVLTVRDVARLRAVVEAKVSPDGESVAYIRRVPRDPLKEADSIRRRVLHVANLQGEILARSPENLVVSTVRWTAD